MHARMNHPVMVVPDAMKALEALGQSTKNGLPEKLLELVHLRASQINGCSVCVDMHAKLAKRASETDERLFAVAAWRDTPYFTEGERAALALTEALTARRIYAAALDVTDPEPLPRDHPLLRLDNVNITPHLGSATEQTRQRMAEVSVENLLAGLAGKPLPFQVQPS